MVKILTFGKQGIGLFLKSSFLILRIVDGVEDVHKLALIGLAAHHKKDDDS